MCVQWHHGDLVADGKCTQAYGYGAAQSDHSLFMLFTGSATFKTNPGLVLMTFHHDCAPVFTICLSCVSYMYTIEKLPFSAFCKGKKNVLAPGMHKRQV